MISYDNDRSFLILAAQNDFPFDPRIILPLPLSPFLSPLSPAGRLRPHVLWFVPGALSPERKRWWESTCVPARHCGAAKYDRRPVRAIMYEPGFRRSADQPLLSWRQSVVSRPPSWPGVLRKSRIGLYLCVSFSLPIASPSLSRRSVPSFVGHPIASLVQPASRTMAGTVITTIAILLAVIRKSIWCNLERLELSEWHMQFRCALYIVSLFISLLRK